MYTEVSPFDVMHFITNKGNLENETFHAAVRDSLQKELESESAMLIKSIQTKSFLCASLLQTFYLLLILVSINMTICVLVFVAGNDFFLKLFMIN